MSRSKTRFRTRFQHLALLSLLLGPTALLPLLLWPRHPAASSRQPTEQAQQSAADGSRAADAAPPANSAAEHREAVSAAGGQPSEPGFVARIEQLAELGEATAAAALADDFPAARASDAKARQLFDDLLRLFPDAGERSLDLLAALPAPATEPRDDSRLQVLRLVLQVELQQRSRLMDAEHQRTAADQLTAALLALLPQHQQQAELGLAVLDRQPFLRLCHEAAVLGLAQLAGEGAFPREVATRLLLTLWHNLQLAGERSSAELTNLALALLGDADPSKRTAACRHLLADPRYRPIVLAWLREHGESEVASELANIAALELPPKEAMAILREIQPLVGRTGPACMVLGARAPGELGDTYRELLAADMQAGMRADVVHGLLTDQDAGSMAVLELALSSDPKAEVRLQAMLTLSAKAPESHGEQACNAALDDPSIASDPLRLGVVLLALQNLAAAGQVNAVDRLGQRLRQLPLRSDSRHMLEQLLAGTLPGGLTSDQWKQRR